ncbi:D-alanine aminotransferase [Enterococcus florum]|uniref:D-alanine aminotransferase n=1 Tax=Enterococcus florum TaxID=2480627 RepID=A0A4P5PHB6_9ENTE|nr:D-amino-acid transaminase [Enterococcus florum]GCF95052.1 D-alanine aminotransferase [Enterococcus florum]
MKILWNDQIVEESEVKIDTEDRGYQFGDGLYEVIRIYDGVFYMENEHLDRLWRCAEKVRLQLPFERAEFSQRLHRFAEEVGIKNGRLYFQITRGVAKPRLHNYPDPNIVQPVLTGDIQKVDRPTKQQENGVRCGTVADKRWLHCDIKSISLLGNIMALNEAQEKGYDDAVLVRDGIVTETSASNFWMVKDRTLYTHPDGELILPGIAKIKVRELADQLGLAIAEEPFAVDFLMTADECFKTSSVAEVMPIVEIDGQKIGNGTPGEVTKSLLNAYIQDVEETVTKM